MDQIASGSLEFYRYIVRNLGTSIQIILSDLKAYVEGEEGPTVRNFTQNDVSLECGSWGLLQKKVRFIIGPFPHE